MWVWEEFEKFEFSAIEGGGTRLNFEPFSLSSWIVLVNYERIMMSGERLFVFKIFSSSTIVFERAIC